MNRTEYTPGPWKIKDDGLCIKLSEGKYISIMLGGFIREEAHANARLIAAAPELLEALREIRIHAQAEIAKNPMGKTQLPTIDAIAMKAISRAQGE